MKDFMSVHSDVFPIASSMIATTLYLINQALEKELYLDISRTQDPTLH